MCVYVTTGTMILIELYKKADLLEIKVNGMKDRKVHADEKSFELEKNEFHRPKGLGDRSVVVARRKEDETLPVKYLL